MCVWCGCGGGGSDGVLMRDLSITHHSCTKLAWQNTWESDSGVPATLGLNVQMDGGRKMLQNWWWWFGHRVGSRISRGALGRRRILRHRRLKNGHSRPCGRNAKMPQNAAKTPPQSIRTFSRIRSEAHLHVGKTRVFFQNAP